MIQIYNTLTRQKEEFKPLKKNHVGLYTCGPTVYNYAHIGNLRTYVFEDILKRVFEFNDYKVKHVMNITDVGHLVSDGDEGEDKMEKGSAREGKTAWEIAQFYTIAFENDIKSLNITSPNIWCRATDHIKDQIKLIKKLEKKGFAYQTVDGIYFDTSRFPNYGKIANLENQELRGGARIDVGDKRHITDFALWKFSPKLQKRQMEWDSPWGVGFPGWHIECSAMATKYLGQPFDIHCGGIDHIPVHHTNEIAQSEAAEDKPLANYWMHCEFLLADGGDKMAKSGGNFLTIAEIQKHNILPLAYRYLLLQTHYRKQVAFSWESLEAAQNGLRHLYFAVRTLPVESLENDKVLNEKFLEFVNDDLNISGAVALIWDAIKEKSISQKQLLNFDKVLGLQIKESLDKKDEVLSDEIQKIVDARNTARTNKDWAKSDEIRKELEKMGYVVRDGKNGTEVEKK